MFLIHLKHSNQFSVFLSALYPLQTKKVNPETSSLSMFGNLLIVEGFYYHASGRVK